ncbi:MAG: ATP-dependent DNA helicase RecG [Candidatus Levybacteria bacterium]|nr:ATP-dependent DNA helicase RecG [Candidatus Levybacteria bacterium]
MQLLTTPIKDAGGIYKRNASRLEKLGIITFSDFLTHIPFRYENYSLTAKISSLQPGEVATVRGKVVEMKNIYTKSFKTFQQGIVVDDTGTINILWFNQPFLTRYIKKDMAISLAGRIELSRKGLSMQSPDYEMLNSNTGNITDTIHTGRLVPIYRETKGITSKWLRRQTYNLLTQYNKSFEDPLPKSVQKKYSFISLQKATYQVHFPDSLELAKQARERLAFDELFLLQLQTQTRKQAWRQNLTGHSFSISRFKTQIEKFWEKLPFELTNAQKRAVKEIFADLAGNKPMNRLLQGDVGSGKTVVSAIAMYLAHLNGYQSVLMAPTEILANQHYQTISKLLTPFGVRVGLATGSNKKYDLGFKIKEKGGKIHKSKIINHKSDILIGTHAVLSKKIKFDKLGLVVIDEQQRFGVEQRGIIRQKGDNPHLLTMTATPIPRTVALTLYGDLDLSYLDEMPIGRKIIKTWLVPKEKRDAAYGWIEKEIMAHKTQAFIICPFIEESESMQTVKAATKEFERLQRDIFPDRNLGLVHGKLKSKEKDAVLQGFKDKKYEILVATPVVEVGIDIQNATIILIEASERFGLSQLHQLRGRVGRSDKQSYCLLFTESTSELTMKRLKAMESMHSGAELAELDLHLRGPGEIYGTMQHGRSELKIASFSDFPLIEKARNEAESIFPKLDKFPLLQKKLIQTTEELVSPD